jgi:hypothetical protein
VGGVFLGGPCLFLLRPSVVTRILPVGVGCVLVEKLRGGRGRLGGWVGGGHGCSFHSLSFMHAARAREVARGEELERAAAQHASHRQEMERALASLTAEHGEVQEQQTAALEGSAERVRQHEATISTLRKEAVEAAAQHERAAARHSEQVATYEEQLRMIRQFASAAAAPR